MLCAINFGRCVFLVLLDLSTAFDTVAPDVMLDWRKLWFGFTGNVHRLMASFLGERS